MNRIKEVLEEKGIKQTWLAEKTWQELQHGERLCTKQTTTKTRNTIGNSEYIRHRR